MVTLRSTPSERVTVCATRLFSGCCFEYFVSDEQTRHMVRDAFVSRFCFVVVRAKQTRHGLSDALLFGVTVLINLFTKTNASHGP